MPLRTECPRCPTPLETPPPGAAERDGWSCPEHGPTPALRRPVEVTYEEFATVLNRLGLDGRRLVVPGRKRLDIDHGEVIREICT